MRLVAWLRHSLQPSSLASAQAGPVDKSAFKVKSADAEIHVLAFLNLLFNENLHLGRSDDAGVILYLKGMVRHLI